MSGRPLAQLAISAHETQENVQIAAGIIVFTLNFCRLGWGLWRSHDKDVCYRGRYALIAGGRGSWDISRRCWMSEVWNKSVASLYFWLPVWFQWLWQRLIKQSSLSLAKRPKKQFLGVSYSCDKRLLAAWLSVRIVLPFTAPAVGSFVKFYNELTLN